MAKTRTKERFVGNPLEAWPGGAYDILQSVPIDNTPAVKVPDDV